MRLCASQRRIIVAGCENAATLTTAATSGRRDATSSTAPAPTECPMRPMRRASTSERLVSHRMACSTSSAKRGSDAKVSLSLAPWQRASTNSEAKPASQSGRASGSIIAALPPQPCSTITLGQGNAVAIAGGISQPCSRRPFAVSIRTVSNRKPYSAGVRSCAIRGAARLARTAHRSTPRSSPMPATVAATSARDCVRAVTSAAGRRATRRRQAELRISCVAVPPGK